ncbi:hypothetical protein Dsin_026473 [Dipteronia sinensis]|uniref:Uncharacterized protein n=1 Tax=Dipteronia sinensis TaxID=43782 RepID=A0AAD9ZZB2_9ROSI|nr:hypothetical protein Dsin_026473 [Dipteronia sinensis]
MQACALLLYKYFFNKIIGFYQVHWFFFYLFLFFAFMSNLLCSWKKYIVLSRSIKIGIPNFLVNGDAAMSSQVILITSANQDMFEIFLVSKCISFLFKNQFLL